MKRRNFILTCVAIIMMACQSTTTPFMISESTIQQALTGLAETHPHADMALAERGVRQMAALWQETDGAECFFVPVYQLDASLFGLDSIRRAVSLFQEYMRGNMR